MNRREFLKTAGKTALVSSGIYSGFSFFKKIAESQLYASSPCGISWKKYRLKMRHQWTISRDTMAHKDIVVISVEKDGITGLGEAAPSSYYHESTDSVIAFMEKAVPLIQHSDLFAYREMHTKIGNLVPGEFSAKAALDMAILDWVAKKLGVPLYKLFGLNKRKAPVTSFSIGIDTPAIVQKKVKEAHAYPLLKVKVGHPGEKKMMEAIRRVTNKTIRVDANGGWKSKEEALEKIEWLSSLGVEFVEQPLPNAMRDDIAWIRERTKMPIIADEPIKTAKDIPPIAGAYDGINIKLMKCGGVQEALGMIALARGLGLKIMLGCMIESSISISAAAHISPLVDYADLDGNLLVSNNPFSGGVKVVKGKLVLPDAPGLGVH